MTLVLAHRGARRVAPENTVLAFGQARELGADGVELDVHATADRVLMVDHDGAPTGVGPIAAALAADVRAAQPSIPTLSEALDACRGLLVNIEVKNLPMDHGWDPEHGMLDPLAELLEARGYADRVLVSSFNLDTIDRLRADAPQLATGYLTFHQPTLDQAIELAVTRGHAAVHPYVDDLLGSDPAAAVERAHAAGLALHCWTVNDPDQMEQLVAAGVDALITDVPEVARSVVDSTAPRS